MVRDQRVGPAERTEVLGLLGDAYEAGLLPAGEYDSRVAAAGTATYESQLRGQLSGLPPAYAWNDRVPEPAPAAGRVALILGIASIPLAVCAVGGVLGVLAVVAGRQARPGLNAPFLGRVFGLVGVALSLAAIAAVLVALNQPVGP